MKKYMADIRSVIGTVLIIFGGFLLLCSAFTTTPVEMEKTGGINANLYSGLALLVVGIVMWVWAVVSPEGGKSPDVLDDDKSSASYTAVNPSSSATGASAMASGASANGMRSTSYKKPRKK